VLKVSKLPDLNSFKIVELVRKEAYLFTYLVFDRNPTEVKMEVFSERAEAGISVE
jgi:hypothetical protein